MTYEFPVTRRTFLKLAGSSTLAAITVRSLAAGIPCTASYNSAPNLNTPDDFARIVVPPDWAKSPGVADYRIDGMPKVLGQKMYARDFKARDFGWMRENWVYAVRCDRIGNVFERIDLSMLPRGQRPVTVVDFPMIDGKSINSMCYQHYGSQDPPLLARPGYAPDFYGQPAALLIFEDFDSYRKAKKVLDFNPQVVQYGAAVSPTDFSKFDNVGLAKYARYNDPQFSYVRNLSDKNYAQEFNTALDKIKASVASNKSWNRFGTDDGTTFETPAMDPVFMEPESGIALYDAKAQTLRLVLGTQSPNGDATYALNLFYQSQITVKAVDVIACYPGGGFGGRDTSHFAVYLALVAPFASGAVRWQQSRYEQFQMGLKRCESTFSESLWVSDDGKFQAIISSFMLRGGRKDNLQGAVAKLAALGTSGCYDIPRASTSGEAVLSSHPFGGSQRGFGTPQATMAIETLIDEASVRLKIDPFELRRKNLLSMEHGTTIAGGRILFDLQLDEILKALESHRLWKERKTVAAGRKLRYGVGFAMSNHAYGGSAQDGMFGMVEILPDSTLRVRTTYVDMGNGAATALGLAPAEHLGRNAHSIAMGQIDVFNKFGLDPQSKNDATYVPVLYGSASSCLSAFHQFHAVRQASLVLFRQSVLPAACKLWGVSSTKGLDVRWTTDQKLTGKGKRALEWTELVNTIRAMKPGATIAVAHASFRAEFWRSRYLLGGEPYMMDSDFVATGTDPYNLNPVSRMIPLVPPSVDASNFVRVTYAPAGALVSVSVDSATGQVRVEEVVTALSAGTRIVPQIVEGQSNGAVAMAISNVLSESCPYGDDGTGNGRWNLDRYQITRMADMPKTQLIPIPPPAGEKASRGIAEAVMCPIGAALLNALAMATGARFRTTPVTPDVIRKALS